MLLSFYTESIFYPLTINEVIQTSSESLSPENTILKYFAITLFNFTLFNSLIYGLYFI